ncbi:MAG: septum site-determining protein Ssd [Nocardioidaceae bacterium]
MDSVTVPGVPTPFAVTRDPDLVDLLHRLAAAAGVALEVVCDVTALPRLLPSQGALLVDPVAAEALAEGAADRRLRVVVVSRTPVNEGMWRSALALTAERVVVLPKEEAVLLEWLVDVTDARAATGLAVGIVAGSGGAGASTLAAGLARAAADAGDEIFLIDLDPLGGGLELLLGCEDLPGLRWPDIAATRGRIRPTALRKALPVDDGVALLSWRRTSVDGPSAEGAREVLQSARRAGGLVVVDLPRQRDAAGNAALELIDCMLLIGTADVRGAAATAHQVTALRAACDDVRLVVRTTRSSVVSPPDLAAGLGIPLAGSLPTVRGIERAVSEGIGPPSRGRLGRAFRRLHGQLRATGRPT